MSARPTPSRSNLTLRLYDDITAALTVLDDPKGSTGWQIYRALLASIEDGPYPSLAKVYATINRGVQDGVLRATTENRFQVNVIESLGSVHKSAAMKSKNRDRSSLTRRRHCRCCQPERTGTEEQEGNETQDGQERQEGQERQGGQEEQ